MAPILFCLCTGIAGAQTIFLSPRKLPKALNEVSGMCKRPDGGVYFLNDGGNEAALYCLNAATNTIEWCAHLPVLNRDWEDLTCDPAGNLYIGDFGNNRNDRRDLRVYTYCPETKQLDSILFSYPDQWAYPPLSPWQWNFDCEAMVWYNDSLHLFSKNRFVGNGYTKHYVIPSLSGIYVADLSDSIYLKKAVVTGAALHPDAPVLALCTYYGEQKWGFMPSSRGRIFLFEGFAGTHFFRGTVQTIRLRKFLVIRQYESLLWSDAHTLLLANERHWFQKARIKRYRINTIFP